MGSGEPQYQLTVRTKVAVDERRYRRGQGIAGKIKSAHNFRRDILRGILGPIFGGVKCDDADRVAVLAGHQVGDDGFEVGLADVGFRECSARLPVIVDDEIKSLIVTVRHNRRGPAPTHRQYSTNAIPGNLSTKSRRRNRNGLPPMALPYLSVDAVGHTPGVQNVAGTTAKN